MNTAHIVDIFDFFGGFLAILLTLGQMVLKKKDGRNYLFAFIMLLMAIYQYSISLHLFFDTVSWQRMFPCVHMISTLSVCLLIPLIYFYFRTLPESSFIFSKNMLFHFIPAAAAIIVLTLPAIWNGYPLDAAMAARNYKGYVYKSFLPVRIFSLSTIILQGVYLIAITRYYVSLYRKARADKRAKYVAVLLWSFLTLFLIFSSGFFIALFTARHDDIYTLYSLYTMRFTVITIFTFLYSYRYPFAANIVNTETLRTHYARSRTGNLRIDSIVQKLEKIMDEEKAFIDESLTIEKTAAALGITSHQLSEILNTRLQENFSTWLKKKRVAEACMLLVKKPDVKIIEISLDCGFSSLSTFNTAFRQITGCSPSEYRKQSGTERASAKKRRRFWSSQEH